MGDRSDINEADSSSAIASLKRTVESAGFSASGDSSAGVSQAKKRKTESALKDEKVEKLLSVYRVSAIVFFSKKVSAVFVLVLKLRLQG